MPVEDRAIEQVPILARTDLGSGLRADLEKTFADQHLNGFAQGVPADPELRDQFRFRRQKALGAELVTNDPPTQLIHHLVVQSTAGEQASVAAAATGLGLAGFQSAYRRHLIFPGGVRYVRSIGNPTSPQLQRDV